MLNAYCQVKEARPKGYKFTWQSQKGKTIEMVNKSVAVRCSGEGWVG